MTIYFYDNFAIVLLLKLNYKKLIKNSINYKFIYYKIFNKKLVGMNLSNFKSKVNFETVDILI